MRIRPELAIFILEMRNYISFGCLFIALGFFLYGAVEVYESRTDSMTVMISYGFMLLFCALSLVFAFLKTLDEKFDALIKVLNEHSDRLGSIIKSSNDRFWPSASNITVTFQGKSLYEIPSLDVMDKMTLEELEQERLKAEKSEDYEKAAVIQKKIDQRRRKG